MIHRACISTFVCALFVLVSVASAEKPAPGATPDIQSNTQLTHNTVVPSAPSWGGRIVAHYSPSCDTGYVRALKRVLRDFKGYGWRVDVPEAFNTRSSDVRWYYSQDEDYADGIAAYIAANIRSAGYHRAIKRNSKVNFDRRKPKPGTIELFLCNR